VLWTALVSMWRDERSSLYSIHLFSYSSINPSQRPLSPTRAHWARQANRLSAGQTCLSLGLGLYREQTVPVSLIAEHRNP